MRYTGHKRRPRVRCWLALIVCNHRGPGVVYQRLGAGGDCSVRRTMTTKSLARICEMGRSGACLKEIAQDTGYCISTVGKWLRHQGIGPPGQKYIPRRIYTVYKTKTTEFLVEGNAKKCASFLGIKLQSFRRAYTWSHRGAPGKYTIYARDAESEDVP